ncbi:glycosyltransferase family 4 protein [Vogesella urethralis]|uniref:glycosyltransferase family 4 protein n=1 Tax=Vogesella urethralis TaxID=2592656 RepID=UPI001186E9E1|nr:glycosyltransferase family 1 protein [Vogesella urethralis]
MMLAVDARWMVGEYRGMGRYARSFIEPVQDSVSAFLPESSPAGDLRAYCEGNGFFPWWEQQVLPAMCGKYKVERLLCPYNTGPLRLRSATELILVVHDLIFLESWRSLPPSVSPYQTLGRVYRRYVVPGVIARADKIVTVSEYTKGEILKRFNLKDESVLVIPNSLDASWYEQNEEAVESHAPYVLAVSGEAPSKNLSALLHAFSLLKKRGGRDVVELQLRIVGIKQAHQAHFIKRAEQLGIGSSVVFERFVDEITLRSLYRNAELFVMPSLFEGFGIPVLEAMASGTAVVCSNTTSLPEVVGDAGWLFDPYSIEHMAGVLLDAWRDSCARAQCAERGLKQAQKYHRKVVNAAIENFWEK